MTDPSSPSIALREGRWFKLICGASFQHLPAIRSLALAYGLAGVDCIDMAADSAVIESVRCALDVARAIAPTLPPSLAPMGSVSPWLMVSLNDGDDPHFRKAVFDPQHCPADCPRPCERVCPTQAIQVRALPSRSTAGVIESLCYGCGRCLSICPHDRIEARYQIATPEQMVLDAIAAGVEAFEIHTQIGRDGNFARLWRAISPHLEHLKLVAVSCPGGPGHGDYLRTLHGLMAPDLAATRCQLLWQADGRPMSGDIGGGTTHAAIALGRQVLALGLPGFVQLAGGTNDRTWPTLRSQGLLPDGSGRPAIAGVAYGGYGRSRLQGVLDDLAAIERERGQSLPLETLPALLHRAVAEAKRVVALHQPCPTPKAMSP